MARLVLAHSNVGLPDSHTALPGQLVGAAGLARYADPPYTWHVAVSQVLA